MLYLCKDNIRFHYNFYLNHYYHCHRDIFCTLITLLPFIFLTITQRIPQSFSSKLFHPLLHTSYRLLSFRQWAEKCKTDHPRQSARGKIRRTSFSPQRKEKRRPRRRTYRRTATGGRNRRGVRARARISILFTPRSPEAAAVAAAVRKTAPAEL